VESQEYIDLAVDLHTNSAAGVTLRRFDDGKIGFGFNIESDGDLDLMLTDADARRFAEAILSALDRK
jgi:hypothetical protein